MHCEGIVSGEYLEPNKVEQSQDYLQPHPDEKPAEEVTKPSAEVDSLCEKPIEAIDACSPHYRTCHQGLFFGKL
jgi:hypothetical protein